MLSAQYLMSCFLRFVFGPYSQVIILPGAMVPPLAYAPLARTLAQKGHTSYVVRFDFGLGAPTAFGQPHFV